MAEIKSLPPSDEVKAIVGAIPDTSFTPGVVVAHSGPEGRRGPEDAGAILILMAMLADEEGAERFWRTTASVHQTLPEAPGFIRSCAFFDGPIGYLLAFWHTVEDAERFARQPAHREAAAALARDRFLYGHFVGIWKAEKLHPRHIFCERCGTATTAPTTACSKCGNALDDYFSKAPALSG
jgi:heme-degrading monooxygenase HmoA